MEAQRGASLSWPATVPWKRGCLFSLFSAVTAFKWSNNGQLRRESFVALYLEI